MAGGLLPATDSMTRTVAILIFDEVEVLDFAGPFEVFSVAGRQEDGPAPFDVVTVARTRAAVHARNGLTVVPHHDFESCPQPDILQVPGGYGTRALLEDAEVLEWIRSRAAGVELLLSVCTGSLLLARAGLLDGRPATPHWMALDSLQELLGSGEVVRDRRVVDSGDVIVSAGVAAGIDMSFHVLARLGGEELAEATARYIEYPWRGSSSALGPASPPDRA